MTYYDWREILMNQRRKEIQTARMWSYFLDAASKLIKEKGLHNITIREIADEAGFTSSTVYNYFKDLSHLKFFAVMRFTKSYVQDLPSYMEKGNNTIEKWLYSWECFCRHSFELPEIYDLLYIENLGTNPEKMIQDYYQVYENELIDLSEDMQDILMNHNIAKRSSLYIQAAVDEGFINQEEVEYIAGTTMLIWTGMITNVLNLRKQYSKEEAIKRTMYYIEKTILNTIVPKMRTQIHYKYKE